MTIMTSMIDKFRPLMAPPDEGAGGGAPPSSPSTPGSSPGSGSNSGGSVSPNNSGASPTPATPTIPSPGGAAPASSRHAGGVEPTPDVLDFNSIFEGPQDAPPSSPAGTAAPAATPPTPAPAAPPKAVAPEPAPPVPPVVPPAQPPAAAPPPAEVQPGAPASGQPPPAQAAVPASEPVLDPYDPGQLGARLSQQEGPAIEHVASTMFKLTQEEVEALEADVVGTVPKLLAKAFVKSQQATLGQLARMMPVMIQRQTEALRQNAQHEAKFFSRWPDIKADQHGEIVRRYASVFRQMHPQATADEMIEQLGPMVMMSAKIVPGSVPAPGVVAVPNPVAQPAVNGRPPPPSAFVPAGAGPVNAGTPAPELTAWEAMFQPQE